MNGTTTLPWEEISGFTGIHQYLSNFWEACVTMEGKVYPTTEHAFQAAKTLDPDERRQIRMEVTPGRAKRLGRKVALRHDWDEIKEGVMLELVRQKFTTHPELARRLIHTGNARIVEENHWNDTLWGVCDGVGENRLGEILMRVRSELRDLAGEIS